MTPNYSHCIHNWPVTRERGNSFKFRRVGSARYWHDALRPLLRIARFLLASWPVQRKFSGSDFKVVSTATSRFWGTYLWPHVLPFLRVRGDFFVRARSASVALGEAGLVFHVLLLEYASTFLLCLVPILVPFFPPFVHFLLCFYRKGKITFLTSLTKIMINPLSNKKMCRKMLW